MSTPYPERGSIPWDLALKEYIDAGDESESGVGSVGPQGPKGDPGVTGPVGPKGDPGDSAVDGVRWRGSWDAENTYNANDIVSYANGLWIASVDGIILTPGTSSEPPQVTTSPDHIFGEQVCTWLGTDPIVWSTENGPAWFYFEVEGEGDLLVKKLPMGSGNLRIRLFDVEYDYVGGGLNDPIFVRSIPNTKYVIMVDVFGPEQTGTLQIELIDTTLKTFSVEPSWELMIQGGIS